MSTPQESLALLARALDQTEAVLAGIRPEQLADPTPCTDWDLGRLIAHVTADPRNLLAMARGEEVDWSAGPEPAAAGWTEDFRAGADDLLRHWLDLGDEAPAFQIDWQIAEFAVHTWDLAHAGDWAQPLDQDVAERGLAFMANALTTDNRGDAFGPEQTAPSGADAYDRIAAFSGRPVT